MFSFIGKIKSMITRKLSFKTLVSSIISGSILLSSNSALAYYNSILVPEIVNDLNIRSPIQVKYVSSSMEFKATAYSLEEGSHITASGQSLYDVTGYAVASNYFPIGTRLYIECPSASYVDGEYTVLDTGDMASNVIDIAMWTISECNSFGIRTIYVTVLD